MMLFHQTLEDLTELNVAVHLPGYQDQQARILNRWAELDLDTQHLGKS